MDEILNLIESVSEGFPSYFCVHFFKGGYVKSYIFLYILSRIIKTWYKLTVLFGSFEIGPNYWLNWHVES